MQTNSRRALAGAGIFAAVVCGVAFFALPSDREVAERITELAEAKLGVRVTLGKVHWSLLPRPSIEIEDAATVQPEPISFKRLVAHPRLADLVRRKLVFKDLTIDGGVMPQLSLRGLTRSLCVLENLARLIALALRNTHSNHQRFQHRHRVSLSES